MIKCFFVDVKSIKSALPKANFIESELEQLADLILEADGLLRPLILQEIKVGKYQVVEGHREYYAAVRAKEKNIAKAEMVNAFVIDASNHKSAIAQLALLSGTLLSGVTNTPGNLQLDRLLPAIESAVSEQLQPILAHLAKHTEILDRLTLARSIPPETTTIIEPISDRAEPPSIATPIPNDIDSPRPVKPKAERITRSTTKKTAKTVDPGRAIIVSSHDIPEPLGQSAAVTVTKSTKTTTKNKHPSTKSTSAIAKTKPPSAVLASIDPTKANNVLTLINTLNLQQLTVSMERSGLKTSVKLVPAIIEYRDKQPGRQIDSWETIIDAKITGLNAAAVKKIIDKLK